MDAIDRARRKALVASRTELRDDDDVDSVVENRPERLRTSPQTGIAIDARTHVDLHRRVLPHRISFSRFETQLSAALGFVVTRSGGHLQDRSAQVALAKVPTS